MQSVSRIVRVESVRLHAFSTRAIAWGYDVHSGEHVAFTLAPRRGEHLQAELEAEGEAFFKPGPLEILFTREVSSTA
jgi:hypothetical protein